MKMDWADDFKFTLKKSAKKGRRAAAASTTGGTSSGTQEESPNDKPNSSTTTTLSTPEQELSLLDKDFDDDINDFDVKEMMKTKKTGGWADEPVKFGKNNKSNTNLIEQERFNSITSTSLSDDDIPVIPDLDDIKDEMLLNEMVEAPTVSVNRVATYNELNSDLLKQGAFATLEDVDLSALAKCLQNEIFLNEPDEIWTWDKLFTEVSAEINAEKPQSASTISDRKIVQNNTVVEVMTKYVE